MTALTKRINPRCELHFCVTIFMCGVFNSIFSSISPFRSHTYYLNICCPLAGISTWRSLALLRHCLRRGQCEGYDKGGLVAKWWGVLQFLMLQEVTLLFSYCPEIFVSITFLFADNKEFWLETCKFTNVESFERIYKSINVKTTWLEDVLKIQ